jgi:hypothetical protein
MNLSERTFMFRRLLPFLLLTLSISPVGAATIIDFDSLFDGDSVTTGFAGLTFTNAVALTRGLSLNEFEFPPRSGDNVISDSGGAMKINFSSQISSFAAFFNYTRPLTLRAFNSSNVEIGTASSLFLSNLATSGDFGSLPNENLSLSIPGGISSVTIEGDPNGASFTLDDLTYEPLNTNVVPEPSHVVLLMSGVGAMLFRFARKSNAA